MIVSGEEYRIDADRVIFVGLSETRPDEVFVKFLNKGAETQLVLSKEAGGILARMLLALEPSNSDGVWKKWDEDK